MNKTSFFHAACLAACMLFLPFLHAQNPVSSDGKVTLEDLWIYYKYFPQSASEFRWMNDDQYYSTLESEGGLTIWKNGIVEGKRLEAILNITQLDLGEEVDAKDVTDYSFNSDESKILLKAKIEPIYRRSRKEISYVYDRQTKNLFQLHDGQKVSYATFSPDASKIAYTFDNNLYYYDFTSQKRIQVTYDGKLNHIINGSTDWVYEEELSFAKAFEWSPDNQRIAFFRFDETRVLEFSMVMYGELYPDQHRFKYPKAGEQNALVTIQIYDLNTKGTIPADIGPETDQYISRMAWTPNDNQLALLRLNRLQNQVDLLLVEPASGKSTTLLTEKTDTYVEVEKDKWHFLANSTDFIWTSEASGYNHIYRYSREGKLVKQLTKGKFDVDEILGADEENNKIYFTSTEVSPLERHLYSISLEGKGKKQLTKQEGMHNITFSSSYSYYVDNYSTARDPNRTVLAHNNGKTEKTLVDNNGLRERVNALDIRQPEFFNFETSEGISLNGWMIKPKNFDPNTKHPVLMFCYGGPESQEVLNAWGHGDPFNYMWFQHLAQEGYIVACVDNRGTNGRGTAFKKATHGDLGRLETIDQIETAKYLQQQTYVDPDRIGIWGWSYGGYLTSLCMVKGGGIFKAGIAVAPVTNWRFYDTIYTERYLKRPQENAKGYDENSPINYAKDLQGAYLLVHGMADDNVHYQNSVEWVDALIRANKQFDMFFYPNKNHGIFGGITRYHLYTKMTNFIKENL